MKNYFKYILILVVLAGVGFFVFYQEPGDERENVEKYLRENIAELSPVEEVLGGTWYVLSVIIDIEENSGVVTYEDGHIQEERNFSYTLSKKNEVLELEIE